MTDPLPFDRGDRVKLTDRFAKVLLRGPKVKIDWLARRGVVRRCNEFDVYVAWDGRNTLDSIPVKAVEKT
jgi:hypothetical protein